MAKSYASWQQLWCDAVPTSVQAEVRAVCQHLQATFRAHPCKSSIGNVQVRLTGACLNIPERVYFSASPLKHLANDIDTDGECAILACMYSRHHNDHVREQALRL